MAEKIGIIRSTKAMQAANGRSCVNCGVMDGTVVRAHYTGLRQHQYGKGRGIKPHDCLTADLCQKCHDTFDGRNGNTTEQIDKIDLSEQFLHCIALTLVRDIQDGVLKYV